MKLGMIQELVHLEAAMAIWNHCRESVEYVFGNGDGGDLERLIDWIDNRGGSVTVREVRQYAPSRYRKQAEEWLEKLIASGQGYWDTPDACGRGRPRQLFRLATPATATKFKKRPEISNNVAVATVAGAAGAATAADPENDLRPDAPGRLI